MTLLRQPNQGGWDGSQTQLLSGNLKDEITLRGDDVDVDGKIILKRML
jgi:hypothetical protein